MSKLTVTGLTSLPPDYKGEPCIIVFNIIDVEGGVYESEVHMDDGFNPSKLIEAAYHSFKMCDAEPQSVNIVSFRIKK